MHVWVWDSSGFRTCFTFLDLVLKELYLLQLKFQHVSSFEQIPAATWSRNMKPTAKLVTVITVLHGSAWYTRTGAPLLNDVLSWQQAAFFFWISQAMWERNTTVLCDHQAKRYRERMHGSQEGKPKKLPDWETRSRCEEQACNRFNRFNRLVNEGKLSCMNHISSQCVAAEDLIAGNYWLGQGNSDGNILCSSWSMCCCWKNGRSILLCICNVWIKTQPDCLLKQKVWTLV